MEKPIRIGIVGSRFAAQFHYTAYQRVTGIDVEVVGVTSLTREHREDFAKKHGIKSFDSLEEMLPEVDVIDVCTPGYAHEEVSITALEAGKHIVVEKPFTGYFGPPEDKNFKGNKFPKEKMLEEAIASAGRIIAAALKSKKKLCYAETGFTHRQFRRKLRLLLKPKDRYCGL